MEKPEMSDKMKSALAKCDVQQIHPIERIGQRAVEGMAVGTTAGVIVGAGGAGIGAIPGALIGLGVGATAGVAAGIVDAVVSHRDSKTLDADCIVKALDTPKPPIDIAPISIKNTKSK